MKIEKRICDEFVTELTEEVKEELLIELSPQEFLLRVEDVAYDLISEDVEEDELDLIVESAERLALRKLKKNSNVTFFESDTLYKISAIKDYGGVVNVPGDYTKFWDTYTGKFKNNSPIQVENAQVVDIDKQGVLLVRRDNFRLQVDNMVIV